LLEAPRVLAPRVATGMTGRPPRQCPKISCDSRRDTAAGARAGSRALVRPIHAAQLDKERPALTRELVRPQLTTVTVAPITTTIRGLTTELAVDAANGHGQPSVASCDNVTTIPTRALGPQIGVLLDRQKEALTQAIRATFDLD